MGKVIPDSGVSEDKVSLCSGNKAQCPRGGRFLYRNTDIREWEAVQSHFVICFKNLRVRRTSCWRATGVYEWLCACVHVYHVGQVSAFKRPMRRQLYNVDGTGKSQITNCKITEKSSVHIPTFRHFSIIPAMIIWLVSIPWPRLTYHLSFGLVPCLLAPEGRWKQSGFSISLFSPLLFLSSCG